MRVTLTCVGGGGASMPQVPVRLACTHNYGTDSCHMGRIEVFNPTAVHEMTTGSGTWGTVCGHWLWDNNASSQAICPGLVLHGYVLTDCVWLQNFAQMACRHLGYNDGEIYTFGHTSQLPSLPIVAGFRTCQGTELNIFHCQGKYTHNLPALTTVGRLLTDCLCLQSKEHPLTATASTAASARTASKVLRTTRSIVCSHQSAVYHAVACGL